MDLMKSIDYEPINKLMEDVSQSGDPQVAALCAIVRDLICRLNIELKAQKGCMTMLFSAVQRLEKVVDPTSPPNCS